MKNPKSHFRSGAPTSRRSFLRKTLAAGVALAPRSIPAAGRRNAVADKHRMIQWQTHDVAKIGNGYQVAVADVMGDGRMHILALSTSKNLVEWYENPTWKRRPITTTTQKDISLAPLFRKACPARGLALASDFALEDSTYGGNVWWAEPAADWDQEWALHPVGKITTSHRLRWANLDGRGRPALIDVPLLGYGAVAPNYTVPAPLTWFEMPDFFRHGHGPHQSGPSAWPSHLIDNTLTVVHGVNIFDWDGDGRDEILTASFEGVHLFHSVGHGAKLTWTRTRLAEGDQQSHPARGSSEIGVGKVAGKRFLATIEPWHGNQVVVYHEAGAGELWSRQVIDTSFQSGHALVCADLDGDGNDEIVAGYRGHGTSLYVYYAADDSGLNWERQLLDSEMSTSCLAIADINGDGRPDVVAIGSSTSNVKWYENRS
jgi:hypothetical protein